MSENSFVASLMDRGGRAARPGSDELLFVVTIAVLTVHYWIVLTDQFGGLNRAVSHVLLFAAVVPLYAITIRRSDWPQLAAPAALVIAGLTTAGLGLLLGHPTVWFTVVMMLLFIHWAPAPAILNPGRARVILQIFAVAPLVLTAIALATNLGPDFADLILDNARFAFGQGSPPAAATLLLCIMASTALLRSGARWPHVTRAAAIVMIVLTTSRLYMAIAVVFGAAVIQRAFRRRRLTTPGRWLAAVAPWLLLFVWGFVRALPRSVRSMGAGPHALEGIADAGRHDIWSQYIAAGRSDFATGGGFGRTAQLLIEGIANGWAPHNSYLYFLIDVGVIGLVLVVLGLAVTWTVRVARLHPDDRWVHGVPVLLLPAAAMVEPVFRTLHLTLPLAILLAAIAGEHPSEDEDQSRTPAGTIGSGR